MNDPVNNPPSLFAITAPEPARREAERPVDGFLEQLSAASKAAEPVNATSETPRSESRDDGQENNDPAASESAVSTNNEDQESAETPTVKQESETDASDPSPQEGEEIVADLVVAAETELLAIAPQVESTAVPVFDIAFDSPGGEPEGVLLSGDATELPASALSVIDEATPAPTPEFLLGLEEEAAQTTTLPAETELGEQQPSATTTQEETSGVVAASVLEESTTAAPTDSPAEEEAPIAATRPIETSDQQDDLGDAPDQQDGETAEAPPLPRTASDTKADTAPAVSSAPTDSNTTPTNNGAAVSVENAAASGAERTASASLSTPADETLSIDPTRFVSRVSRAFEMAEQRGGGPIEIRLSPPELGAMQLKLEVKEGVLTASIETDNQTARNALLDNLPALRDRLAEQQIRVEKFDVDVRDESNQGGHNDTEGSENQGRETRDEARDNGRDPSAPRPTTESQTNADSKEPIPTIIHDDGGINLVA